MLRSAAMDFRFVIAGEKPIPGKRIGREVFFEEDAGIAGGLHTGHQPLASGSCVRIEGLARRFAGNHGAAFLERRHRRTKVGFAPARKVGKIRLSQKRGGTAQPPPAQPRKKRNRDQDCEKPGFQGSAPPVATSVQVGLAEPIWRAKVQISVTSRWVSPWANWARNDTVISAVLPASAASTMRASVNPARVSAAGAPLRAAMSASKAL